MRKQRFTVATSLHLCRLLVRTAQHVTQLAHTTALTIAGTTVTVQCVPSTTVAVVGANSVVTVVLTATITSGALINIYTE